MIVLALLGAALASAEPAMVVSSATFDAALAESTARLSAGDPAAARQAAAQAVAARPRDPRGYMQRSTCDLKLGAFAEAISDSTMAIELHYEKAAPYNVRSAARAALGQFEDALADADHALRLAPTSAVGYANRAVARAGLKASAAEVAADYAKAAELNPRYRAQAASAAAKLAATKAAAPPAVTETEVAKNPPTAAPAPAAASRSTPRPRSFPRVRLPGKGEQEWVGLAAAAILLFALAISLMGPRSHRLRQVRFGALLTAPPPSTRLSPGAVIAGRYICGQHLQTVDGVEYYEARDLEDQPRLIKRFATLPGSPAGDSLARAQRAAGLRGPSLELVEAFFQNGPDMGVVCEPPPGESLERLRGKSAAKRLLPDQCLRWLPGACAGLDAAHEAGLVHGRLSPRSIWIERGLGRLADFGLPPVSSCYSGAEGPPSAGADVCALAASLFEALTGQLPFGAEEPGSDRKEFVAATSLAEGLPAGLDAVFARAFDPESGRRFARACELLVAVKNAFKST